MYVPCRSVPASPIEPLTDKSQTTAVMELPEPLVSVTPTGLFVEWHARGINVEVRVREIGTYVLVEDRFGVLEDYSGNETSAIGRALSALCVMESRRGE